MRYSIATRWLRNGFYQLRFQLFLTHPLLVIFYLLAHPMIYEQAWKRKEALNLTYHPAFLDKPSDIWWMNVAANFTVAVYDLPLKPDSSTYFNIKRLGNGPRFILLDKRIRIIDLTALTSVTDYQARPKSEWDDSL